MKNITINVQFIVNKKFWTSEFSVVFNVEIRRVFNVEYRRCFDVAIWRQSITHVPILKVVLTYARHSWPLLACHTFCIFASQGFRSRSPLSSPLADWAGISDPRALDFYWMQLLLAASNQIAAYNRSRKHHVYAVKNVNTRRSHFTYTYT